VEYPLTQEVKENEEGSKREQSEVSERRLFGSM
jgi:hypothetical protein